MTTLPGENGTVEGTIGLFTWVNDSTEGFFFPSILGAIFFVLFMMLRGTTTNGRAFLGSAFICFLSAMALSVLGFLATTYLYVYALLLGLGLVFAYLEGR